MLDLTDLPIIDAHSHALPLSLVTKNNPSTVVDRSTITGMCLASSALAASVGPDFVTELSSTTPFAIALVRELAKFFECEPTLEAVLRNRQERLAHGEAYLRALMAHAGISALIVDDGYPQPRVPPAQIEREYAVPVGSVARIEPLISAALETADSFHELQDDFTQRLSDAIRAGAIAIKSIIAYRSGLDVIWPSGENLEAHFVEWKDAGFPNGRGSGKIIRDALAYAAADVAKSFDIPFHIHCGGGDSDVLLEYARPACMFGFLKDRADQDVVLIHSGWPWTDEAAFIASVLPKVYLETSLATPWASLAIEQKLTTLIGIAPPRKIFYGSDASSEPEILWFSALTMRRALARTLGQGISSGWIGDEEAMRIAADILADNVRRSHRLSF